MNKKNTLYFNINSNTYFRNKFHRNSSNSNLAHPFWQLLFASVDPAIGSDSFFLIGFH